MVTLHVQHVISESNSSSNNQFLGARLVQGRWMTNHQLGPMNWMQVPYEVEPPRDNPWPAPAPPPARKPNIN